MPLCLCHSVGMRDPELEKSVQRWDFYVKLNLQLHPGWDVDDCMIDVFRSLRFHSNAIFFREHFPSCNKQR